MPVTEADERSERARWFEADARVIEVVTAAAVRLGQGFVGALIAIERRDSLRSYATTGTALEAVVDEELLVSIFWPGGPLHDGAVVIQADRVAAAGCFLPLTEDRGVSRLLGTRHRAALGLSEATDALVVVASEETGVVSLAVGGRLLRNLDRPRLLELLREPRQADATSGASSDEEDGPGKGPRQVAAAAAWLARAQAPGAIVVAPPGDELDRLVRAGRPLDAVVDAALITTLLWPGAPLHRGAVVVREGRVAAAGCPFPPPEAAAEREEAAAALSRGPGGSLVVLTDEAGQVHLAVGGAVQQSVDRTTLLDLLQAQAAWQPAGSTPPAEAGPADDAALAGLRALAATDVAARLGLGRELLERDQVEEAAAQLERAKAEGAPRGEACYWLAHALLRQRQWRRAAQELQEARASLSPEDERWRDATYLLGRVYERGSRSRRLSVRDLAAALGRASELDEEAEPERAAERDPDAPADHRQLAQRLRAELLPRALPRAEGLEVGARLRAADDMQGDAYDLVPLAGGGLLAWVVDASGRGLAPAHLLLEARAALRALAPVEPSPARLLAAINRVLHDRPREGGHIASGLLVRWEPQASRVVWSCAGHAPPIHWSGAEGRASVLRGGGVVLGAFADAGPMFEDRSLPFVPGDALLLYTDGALLGTLDASGLRALVERWGRAPAGALVAQLEAELAERLGKARDDVVLVALRRVGS